MEIATLKVGSTIFSTAFAILREGTPIWPNVGLDAYKIIVWARCTDFVAGKLADVSEAVLPPRVMNCQAPIPLPTMLAERRRRHKAATLFE